MTDYRKDFPLLSEIGENTVDGREWIYIDNALPAIVTKEYQESVIAIIQKRCRTKNG